MSVFAEISYERRCEILGAIMLGLTALLFLALVTDGYQGEVHRPIDGVPGELHVLGPIGAFAAKYLVILLGGASHVIYILMGVWGGLLIQHKPLDRVLTRMSGMLVLTFGVATLVHLNMGKLHGGLIGGTFGEFFLRHIGTIGANVIALTLCTVGVLLATDFLFVQLLAKGKTALLVTAGGLATVVSHLAGALRPRAAGKGEAQSKRHRGGRTRSVAKAEGEPALDESPLSGYPEGERSLPNIRINEPRTPALEKDFPFDDIPPDADEAPEGSAEHEAAAVSTQGGYPGESVFDDEAAGAPFDEVPMSPAGSDLDSPSAFDGFEDAEPGAAASGLQTEMDLEATPAAEAKPKGPMLRRKASTGDVIPPDYEYPKRYAKPSITMFDEPPEAGPRDTNETLIKMSARLEETLRTFGIEARVTDVTRGPTITRFELEPSPGIKVSRFLALADDIALSLKAHRVRVEAPIPGKGRVGVEVPNAVREPVVVRELLESKIFRKSKTILPLALGKDIAGDVAVVDLATMPHCLVAGATGAGKTVCVKSLLASLLYSKTPEELQLMLIDPKMVELSIFDDIPHLITPVVTDPKKAAASLNWLITEMEERYRLFAHLRVRNIEVYNASVENGEIELVGGESCEAEEAERDEAAEQDAASVAAIRKLPYIVCMIDELADLMMIARAEVEDAIARLAQLARAVGIHLIIATQRPSVDVLTGVIKANFPARISFQVSSRVDSRCILDVIGAERLIGQGDMLYLPAGQSKPARLQGAFVSDPEMESLIAYLKTQAPPQYRDEIENFGKSREQVEEPDDQDDAMFDDAVRVVLDTGQASISMVQRRLRVGYTRAARLVDMMELRGIVGPHIGSKAREILVDVPPKNEVA
jgi:DNA segregation ATPase FtsK/SpoIIIE, S-DNA-T family